MRDDRRSSIPSPVVLAVLLPLASILSACGGSSSGSMMGSTPTVALQLNQSSISMGQGATLTWSSTSATSCTASGAWSGSEPTSGSMSVSPTTAGSATYTLTCAGSGGSSAQSVTLSVSAAAQTSGPFTMTSLVADISGTAAQTVDKNLINPWGVSMAPGQPVWVANAGSQTSTLYDGSGKKQPFSAPLVVNLPAGAGSVAFAPTGIVANASSDFVVSAGGKSGASAFIFSGEGGMIAGWSPTVNATNAVTTYVDGGGAVYKGLAIAANSGSNFIYATDFHNNKIDVFNGTFQKQTPSSTSFSFADSTLPAGYAPFGIQAVNNGTGGATQLYVTYAKQAPPDNVFNEDGAGLGLVDVFDTNGTLIKHVVAVGGKLNAPWGIALAPSDFAPLSDDLLIGNLGDGTISAFNLSTGAFVGAVSDSNGNPLVMSGLWGIVFGNDSNNQPHNTLFFAAGTDEYSHGTYGRIDVGASPPTLNKTPVVTMTAPLGAGTGGYGGGGNTVHGVVTVSATVGDSIAIAEVKFFANGKLIGTVTAAPYSMQWDTTKVANGPEALVGAATDIDGNIGTSAPDNVTVSN
jgi:uncharacterized protein (TIGR03118 family)